MAKNNHSESQREAVARYHAKTYQKLTISLRLEEDADIIKAINDAQENGISYREWLRELFENQK